MTRIPDVPPFAELLAQRLSRRRLLQTGAALAVAGPALFEAGCASVGSIAQPGFKPIVGGKLDAVVLPPGYTYDVIVRWGESLDSSTPDLDASKLADGVLFDPQAAERQSRQFGQNCDAIHFFPLDPERGVLCVNNEYTDDALMFAGHPGFLGAVRGEGRAY